MHAGTSEDSQLNALDEAWELVRRDALGHPLGHRLYISVASLAADDLMAIGMATDELERYEHVTVGVRDGVEVGAGVEVPDGRTLSNSITAVVAGCVQDVIEETSREAWPTCPAHGGSLHVAEHDDGVVWRCPKEDYVVAIGSLQRPGGGTRDQH